MKRKNAPISLAVSALILFSACAVQADIPKELPDSQTAETVQTVQTEAVTVPETEKTVTETVTEAVSETLTETDAATAVSETAAQAVTAEDPVLTTEPATPPTENYTKNSYKAINYSEMKGVWISYIEVSVLLRGKNESEFRRAAVQIYENCLSLGINTVYVHARAFGDSFYYSELFPFTKHISGAIGVKTDYDPYLILIDEAHKRGISFHAWINPLRLCGSGDLNAVSSDYQIKKWYDSSAFNGSYLVQVDGTWYLNPAYDQTVKLVSDGVREIVSRYNVDGIHIDDYFYPTTDESFDSIAYAASDASSLSAFRTENCNKLVREIYRAVHECSDTVVFGISPQGSNSNNLNLLYADVRAWCKGGYVDYFVPQIYYGFQNSTLPFKECADEWDGIVNGTKTQLCIGLAVYKIGAEDQWADEGRYEWLNSDTMLRRQIEYAQSCKNYGGIALYCYNYNVREGFLNTLVPKEITHVNRMFLYD